MPIAWSGAQIYQILLDACDALEKAAPREYKFSGTDRRYLHLLCEPQLARPFERGELQHQLGRRRVGQLENMYRKCAGDAVEDKLIVVAERVAERLARTLRREDPHMPEAMIADRVNALFEPFRYEKTRVRAAAIDEIIGLLELILAGGISFPDAQQEAVRVYAKHVRRGR